MARGPKLLQSAFLKDIKSAYFILWILFSSVTALLFISVIFIDESHIYGVSSMLQAHHDSSCIFCGMTGSFVNIIKGNFTQSGIVNEAAIPVFSILVTNQGLFFTFLISKLFKTKRRINEHS